MASTTRIEVRGENPLAALRAFFQTVLEKGQVQGVMVAQQLPFNKAIMPTLVASVEKLNLVNPLAPAFPINAAKVVSRLTRKPLSGKVAVVMRPCEIRAFVELVKLKQGSMEGVVLIGLDCLGAYSNVDYPKFAGEDPGQSTLRFYRQVQEGKGTGWEDFDISPACKACEHPVPANADITIGLLGSDITRQMLVKADTAKGRELLGKLGLPAGEESKARQEAINSLISERLAYRDRMFHETGEAISDLNRLASYLAACVNCYNCRVACPVCYCRECVFLTDVFDHEPTQYLRWAKRKGILKMPTDTVFYHLTRLAHMSTACVGCGQCSNACPNQVPVMELFRTVAHRTQQAFDYEAGRSADEEPPLAVFREDEFQEVVGMSH